jgi:hypothetical protein
MGDYVSRWRAQARGDPATRAGGSLYSGQVVRRVDVRQQPFDRSERLHLSGRQVDHPDDGTQVLGFEPPGVQSRADGLARAAPVTGEQRLGALRRAHPGAITAGGQVHEAFQQAGVQKRQVAGDHDDAVATGGVQRRVEAAQRSRAGHPVRVYRQTEVGKSPGVVAHDEQVGSDPLQDLNLTDDDGAALYDEAALVAAPETARLAAGENGCGDKLAIHERSIMTEARVSRLLTACLHQAISDELPFRLEFYEPWLRSEARRDGSMGLAPVIAVLGFLRTEPGDAYDRVTARAGGFAAEWTVASLSGARRRWVAWLPRPLRARAALRVAAGIVRSVCTTSRAAVRVRRRSARLAVSASLFCSARARPAGPLCGFYAAAAAGTLMRFDLPASARVERCQAQMPEDGRCVVVVDFGDRDGTGRPERHGRRR